MTVPTKASTTSWPRRSAHPGPFSSQGLKSWSEGVRRKTLRLVAQYANACNLFATDPGVVAHKLAVLARHCDTEGRDFDAIGKTILGLGNPLEDVDDFLAKAEEYAKLGVTLIEVMPPGLTHLYGWVAEVGERIVPRLRDI